MNRLLGILVFVFGSRGPVGAASTVPDEPEVVVRRLEVQERTATISGDISGLRRLWSDAFIANNSATGSTYSKSAALELVRRGLIRPQVFTRNIEVIRVQRDIAVVLGSETILAPGKVLTKSPPHRRFTDIWKQDASSWCLLVRHTSAGSGP